MEGIKTLTQTVIACFTDSDIIEVCLKNIKKVKQSKKFFQINHQLIICIKI